MCQPPNKQLERTGRIAYPTRKVQRTLLAAHSRLKVAICQYNDMPMQ